MTTSPHTLLSAFLLAASYAACSPMMTVSGPTPISGDAVA